MTDRESRGTERSAEVCLERHRSGRFCRFVRWLDESADGRLHRNPVSASNKPEGVHVQRRAGVVCLIAIVWAVSAAEVVFAGLDGFGAMGTGITRVGTGNSAGAAQSVAIQSDGKPVVAGYSYTDLGWHFTLVRYRNDGALDPAFGGRGFVITPVGTYEDFATDVAIRADGKIVVVGTASDGAGDHVAVVQYASDGSLDAGFGGGGIVETDAGPSLSVGSVAIQPDGKLVVVGSAVVGTPLHQAFLVLRYDADGALDSAFGSSGVVTTNVDAPNRDDGANAVALQSDGKIVVAGTSVITIGRGEFAVARYNEDGTLDTSFGGTGTVTTAIGTEFDTAYGLAVQGDGKILLAGTTNAFGDFDDDDFALVRYNSDGTLDEDFGNGGIVVTDFAGLHDEGRSVALQSDGKIVVGGTTYGPLDEMFGLARYTSDGALDTTFGNQGKVAVPFGGFYNTASAIAVDPNGNIVATGNSSTWGFQITTARYNSDGTLDAICGDHPRNDCIDTWSAASLLVSDGILAKVQATLLDGPQLDRSDYGDPTSSGGTAYAMCIFDGEGELVGGMKVDRSGAQCGTKACWKATGSTGYSYADKSASAEGVQSIVLHGGLAERSKLQVKGERSIRKGEFDLPSGIQRRLVGSAGATFQVLGSDFSQCFSTTMGTVLKDGTRGVFKVKK